MLVAGGAVIEGVEWAKETAQQIAQATEETYEAGKELVKETGEKIAKTAEEADSAVRNAGRSAKEKVKDALADAKVKVPEKKDRSQALQSSDDRTRRRAKGEEFFEGAKQEIAETWNEAVDKAEDVASDTYKGIKNAYNWITGWFK